MYDSYLLTVIQNSYMSQSLSKECGDPSLQLQSHVFISNINDSVVTLSCDADYSLYGSITSQCVSGEWTPSPDTVMCIADQAVITPTPSTSFMSVYINIRVL